MPSDQPALLPFGAEFGRVYANFVRAGSALRPGQAGGLVIIAEQAPATAQEGQLLWLYPINRWCLRAFGAWMQIA